MSQLKILIIDDNPSDRNLALRELKKLFPKLQYREIIDEADLNDALKRNQFNLVITDYQILWITGLEILRRVKEKRPDCPVIMFTGTGSEEIAVSAMKAGLDDYVIKTPKHYVRLAAAVRSAWVRSQHQKALEEFKETYYRFFEQVPLGLYRLNPLGEIIEANSTLVKLLGGSSQQELQGQNLIDYHILPQAYLQWQQQLNQNSPVQKLEAQIKPLSGEVIWILHSAIALKNRHGKLIYYEGAVADITASKEAEIQRIELLKREKKARKEAETANRIKDEFLATLSHELRTPLNAILGWMQLLRTGKMSEPQTSKALETIERNAKAQNQLIEDLLDVSRIIRGTMKLQFKPVNLSKVIMASLDTVRPAAEAKEIKIQSQFDVNWIEVNGDENRLQQIFWNLLINAVKFTPAKGTIIIRSSLEENTVVIEIADTGQGIAPDVLPYIFDRFRQAETKSSTRTKGGLGLGLAIARHLLEIHGGEIAAYSDGLGLGATFKVQLPFIELNNHSQQPAFLSCQNLPSLKGITILLVEDEPDAREMVTLILEQYDAEVIIAESVSQAIEAYQKKQPDILISDISMPSKDGYDLIRQIRYSQDGNFLPAIALTAHAREEDRQKALEAGFDLHLSKPIDTSDLIDSLFKLARRIR
jgi:PAS domain S-box-containing protein